MNNGYIRLLRVFSTLPDRMKLLDNMIKHSAVVTHNCYRNSVMYSTMEQVEKITALLQLSSAVHFLHDSIVDAMNSLNKKDRLLLILLYIRNADKQNICKFFNFSMRTMYRQAIKATRNFANAMLKTGIDKQWLLDNVKSFLEGNLRIR